jgi:transitional endoplasmic reticulum ATPase
MSQQNHTPDSEASLDDLLEPEAESIAVRLNDIHGLEDEITRIQEAFLPTMTTPDVAIRTPSLLFYGPKGAGKRRVARATAGELAENGFGCAHLSLDDLDELAGGHHPRSGERLAQLVDELRDVAPAALIIEEFEQIRLRDRGPFHAAIEELRTGCDPIAVICLLTQDTPRFNRQQAPEYFDFADIRIHVPPPDDERCVRVLHDVLSRIAEGTEITIATQFETPLSRSLEFEMAHLQHVGRRAVALAQAREPASPTVTTGDVKEAIDHLNAELDDASSDHKAGGSKDFQPDLPSVTFDMVGGLDEVVQRLREVVTYPQRYADLYDDSLLDPASGILLHGPPGTGKTLLAKALATEMDRTFYAVEGAAIKSKWFGQSEKRIRQLFDAARDDAPSLVFFDEFDALAGTRRGASHSTIQSIVNTLLAELDGVAETEDVVVVAATNRPDAIDPAITRSGRIGESIEVPPPDEQGRQDIFRLYIDDFSTGEDVTPRWFAQAVPDGVTGADIAAIVEQAVHIALSAKTESRPDIRRHHIQAAIESHLEVDEDDRRGYQ